MVSLDYERKTYGMAIGTILAALFVAHLPIISLVNLVPTFKEIALGAVVVAVFTTTSDRTDAAAFALVTGMIAAILFNAVYIPGSVLFHGVLAGVGGESAAGSAAMVGLLGGLGALLNLIGVFIFSPIGYAIGGVLGSFANE